MISNEVELHLGDIDVDEYTWQGIRGIFFLCSGDDKHNLEKRRDRELRPTRYSGQRATALFGLIRACIRSRFDVPKAAEVSNPYQSLQARVGKTHCANVPRGWMRTSWNVRLPLYEVIHISPGSKRLRSRSFQYFMRDSDLFK